MTLRKDWCRRVPSAVLLTAMATTAGYMPAAAQSAGDGIETIVVTATKRRESLQDVPIAITALSGTQLQTIGATSFDGFVRTVPGLSYNEAVPGRASFTIRGIATSNTPGNTQATTATYIDDLPTLDTFGAPTTPDLNLFDVERVEVLRGPQGTLFGSGALAGAIRVITNKPDTRDVHAAIESTVSTTAHGSTNFGVNAMLNVPVIEDRLAVRGVLYEKRDSGVVDNIFRNQRGPDSRRVYGGRIAARFTPTDTLTFTGSVLIQRDRPNDAASVFTTDRSMQFDSRLPSTTRSDMTIYNLSAEAQLGWASLVSSTSYARSVATVLSDATPNVGPLFGMLGLPPLTTEATIRSTGRYFAQEIRLASPGEDRLNWLVGAYYLHRSRVQRSDIVTPGAGAILGMLGFPSDTLYSSRNPVPGSETSIFGDLTYRITDTVTASAGLRAFWNRSTYCEQTTGFLNGGDTSSCKSTSEHSTTPKFSLNWKPQPGLMVYAQAAEGYRVGQNNPTIPPDPITGQSRGQPYKADSLWNYELGVKSSWLDNRLTVNAALFYIDWRDIQIDQTTPDNFNFIANAGRAHSQGAELEVQARPLPGLLLTTALAFTDAALDNDNPAVGGRKGDRLPGSSRFTAANAAEYEFGLFDRAQGFVRAEHQYVGPARSAFSGRESIGYGNYNLINLRLGARFEPFEAVLFVQNLADVRRAAFGIRSPVQTLVNRTRPRTVGLTLRADF